MGAFLRKDLIVLLRDRTELTVLLLMPIILIVILGFSLRGLLGGDTEVLEMQVAVVQLDDERAGIERFAEEVEGTGIPQPAARELRTAAEQVSPNSLLQTMLDEPELSDMIQTVEMNEVTARQALEEGEVMAILTIPENFTFHSLQKMLLNQGDGSELQLALADFTSQRADVLQTILQNFAATVNFETAVARTAADGGVAAPAATPMEDIGGMETVAGLEPVSSFQYYTLGMAVMFVLFVSATIASQANVERHQHVFNRILLSNRHPFVYLGGKAISAALVSFVQLIILFAFSTLVLGAFEWNSAEFWSGMAIVSVVLAICIGALTAFLTSLSVRFNSDTVTTIFSGGIVIIFAFAGGSFMPTGNMPSFIRDLGNWTPNGASLTAYLQWMQERDLTAMLEPLSRVGGLAFVLIVLSLLLFPKRGGN